MRKKSNAPIFAQTESLARKHAAALKLASKDVVSYAVAQFVRRAQDLTIRTVGRRPGAGLAPSVQTAKKDYLEYLKFHIRGVKFRKLGDPKLGTHRGRIKAKTIIQNRIPKKEVSHYLARAKALQGRFAAGWNAIAFKKKIPIPAFVKRHGVRDGSWYPMVSEKVYSETMVFDAESKGSGHGNINFVVETAKRSVEKELSGASAKFLAANVRRLAKKLSK